MTKENFWINETIAAFVDTGVAPEHVAALLEHGEALGDMCPYAVHFRQALCAKMAKSKTADDSTIRIFLDLFEVGFAMGTMTGAVAQYQESQEIFKGTSKAKRLKMAVSGQLTMV